MNDDFFFFSRVVSLSVSSCFLFPFRAEEVIEPAVTSLLEGTDGSSTPAGFMNELLVDIAADDVRSEDERMSAPTLLLSYITRLAGSLSFFDGLATAMAMLDIDLILVFRVWSG